MSHPRDVIPAEQHYLQWLASSIFGAKLFDEPCDSQKTTELSECRHDYQVSFRLVGDWNHRSLGIDRERYRVSGVELSNERCSAFESLGREC